MPIITISQVAADAIKAAKGRRTWGSFMARAFCKKRQVPLSLYRLACQLEAAQKGGF